MLATKAIIDYPSSVIVSKYQNVMTFVVRLALRISSPAFYLVGSLTRSRFHAQYW